MYVRYNAWKQNNDYSYHPEDPKHTDKYIELINRYPHQKLTDSDAKTLDAGVQTLIEIADQSTQTTVAEFVVEQEIHQIQIEADELAHAMEVEDPHFENADENVDDQPDSRIEVGQIDEEISLEEKILQIPFLLGWTREWVKRSHSRPKESDVYYYAPKIGAKKSKRYRSWNEIKNYCKHD